MIALLLAFVLAAPICPFHRPVDGPVVRSFAPHGDYGGHWGIDIAAPPGSTVAASAAGTVTFSGRVAGRLSVTLHHGGGVRTSYSYLGSALVSVGDAVSAGAPIGTSGLDHGVAAVHLSLRVGNRYAAPLLSDCRLMPGAGLHLRGL